MIIDLSAAWRGKVLARGVPRARGTPWAELALLAPGGPNRRVFLTDSEDKALEVLLESTEGPWARFGGRVPDGVRTLLVDPLTWGPRLGDIAAECSHRGVNLVVDERRTSPGLSGHFFACEAFGALPDALILGRAWANDRDFAGALARPSVLKSPFPQSSGAQETWVMGVIRFLRDQGLDMAREKEGVILRFLSGFSGRLRASGAGALWGIHPPDPRGVARRALRAGVRVLCRGDALILAPSLDMDDGVLAEGLARLGEAMEL